MRPTSKQLLQSIQSVLADSIAPELSNSASKAQLDMINAMLGELQSQIDPDAQLASQIVEQGQALIKSNDSKTTIKPSPINTVTWSSIQTDVNAINQTLSQEIKDADDKALDSDTLLDIFSWESSLWQFGLLPSEKEQAVANSIETKPNQQAFAEYINKQSIFDAPIVINDIKALAGGFSRRVFLIESEKQGTTFHFIARCSVSGGLLEGGFAELEDEYHAMNTAFLQAFPCPQIYHYEADTSWFGGDFLLMEFRPGKILGSALGSKDEITEEKLQQICTLLAQQHQLRWWDLSEPETNAYWPDHKQLTLHNAVAKHIDVIEQFWRKNSQEPSALIEYTLLWLKRSLNDLEGAPVIVHGDVGFHNLLYDGDDISGLIDWETAHIGCAAEDITYVLTSLKGKISREQFVKWYEAAGGVKQNEKTLDYCNILNMWRNTIVCHVGLAKFCKEPVSKPGLYTLGTQYRVYFQTALIESLKTALY